MTHAPARSGLPGSFALLLGAAVLIRGWQFGNPVIHNDDQFYLLVGDRLLHDHALPYVDIWDRKPVGLFLLYAAIRLLGGDGVIQYQLVATLFAAATALVVARIAGRIAPPRGALAAGMVYLLYLGVFGGAGGQSPVFYNLFTALAALLVVRAIEREGAPAFALGAGAMALMGVAMQVKYAAVFEGVFLGLTLVWQAWRGGTPGARLAGMAAAWVAVALLPTAAAWGWYAALGHGGAFAYANFTSIFQRADAPLAVTLSRLAGMALQLSPLAAAGVIGARWNGGGVHRFVLGWAMASITGVLLFGGFFDHYALPMLVPLSIAAAPVLAEARIGRRLPVVAAIAALALGLSVVAQRKGRAHYGTGPEQRRIAAFVAPRLGGRCLFVFDAELALYRMTHSCLPTRWVFPGHLINASEAGAAGVDPAAEIDRILASGPGFVIATDPPDAKISRASLAALHRGLAGRYRTVLAVPVGATRRMVYQRMVPAGEAR